MAISKIDSDGITAGGITADSLDIGQIGGRKNLAYNGAMTVWQRGTSADTASDNDFMCDRWQVAHTGLDGNVDWDQETSSTPDGFGYALKVSTDASETSLDAADILLVRQKFEGQDLQQLQKGTSGAKSLTVSFWVKSSVASTYTVELQDVDNTRNIGKSYTISSADTWEFKTLTFEGDTSGAYDNDNALSLNLTFWIDAGSNFTSGTFSTAWQAQSNTERVYDTTGWLESASPEFYITGVQLEVGSVATPFEHRSFGEELALCQRYFQTLGSYGDAVGGGESTMPLMGAYYNSTYFFSIYKFTTIMRSPPTLISSSGTNHFAIYRNNSTDNLDDFSTNTARTIYGLELNNTSDASGTAGQTGFITFVASGASLSVDAEL